MYLIINALYIILDPAMQFPKDFTWGTATSSFQIEGAWNKDGKGASIWDTFCQIPGKVVNGDTGELACDHYHRFREDVQLMKQLGINAYRFSIAWPRILPAGRGKVNHHGIAFYSDLIDTLLANDIEPWITLYHWDLPAALQLEIDGWLGDEISDLFADYADVCFQYFGDRVKNWITLNEPWVITVLGYGVGLFAPGRVGNKEPYLVGHNLLKAHAKAVQVYRTKYQSIQGGRIGITNNCDWREAYTSNPKDEEAAERALEFFLAWFTDPIYKGSYPLSMIERLGDRLPKFTPEEQAMIMGSSDFLGLNHYSSMLVEDASAGLREGNVYENAGLAADQMINLHHDPRWKKTAMGWNVVPDGCRKLLEWINNRYEGVEIVITENGGAFDDQLIDGKVLDQDRLDYYEGYIGACHQAIQNGVNLTGYFAWSFMDNFEWASGYSKRFGLHYVDYNTLQRIPKASAIWYKGVVEASRRGDA